MLGWEFPPHLAGGLGTACRAISRGLTEEGVEVLFVVPRLHGGEEAGGVELLACDRVPLPKRRLRFGQAPQPEPEVVRLTSAMRPYDTARLYDDRLRTALTRRGADVRPAVDVFVQSTGEESTLAFRGGYGPSLFTEVERYARVVEHLAGQRAFEVVHAHDWMTYPGAARAASVAAKPLVCHVHACEYERRGEQADPRIAAVESLGFAKADRVVCVSQRTADVVHTRYNVPLAKLSVVHNGIDPSATVHERALAPRPLVLFLGRVTSQKGPEYFLQAAARVASLRDDVDFALAGDGDLLPRTIERAKELGLEERVQFPGFLPEDEVQALFARADAFVLSSVSEPFGLAPLEALQADVPVIVSRQSGVAEVLHSGLKFDYWDVDDLAGKILAVLGRGPLRRQLLEDGRAELPGLRWRHRAQDLKRLYGELVA